MESRRSVQRFAVVTAALFISLALIALFSGYGGVIGAGTAVPGSSGVEEPGTTVQQRKLLLHRVAAPARVEPDRIWGDNKCSKSDIVISQGPTAPLPGGIPTYTVEIVNMCDCEISAVHLTCGWFSSARLINAKVFKRLRYNDCLLNDGKPLVNGGTISFQYANTFLYPLSVSSVSCI